MPSSQKLTSTTSPIKWNANRCRFLNYKENKFRGFQTKSERPVDFHWKPSRGRLCNVEGIVPFSTRFPLRWLQNIRCKCQNISFWSCDAHSWQRHQGDLYNRWATRSSCKCLSVTAERFGFQLISSVLAREQFLTRWTKHLMETRDAAWELLQREPEVHNIACPTASCTQMIAYRNGKNILSSTAVCTSMKMLRCLRNSQEKNQSQPFFK